MHICLPDTREVRPTHGSAYLLYNVHIDGLYHCSLRFKQLLHLHQALSKKFTSPLHPQLPQFPPKKLLPLSTNQVEERRIQLEKYLQNISQDKAICNSSIFNLFLLEAQRESTRIRENQVHLDIELVNGQKIRLQLMTHDSADAVLTAVCRALGLNDRYHAYFCLCLCGYDVVRDKLIIKRRLSFFESPYITLQMAIQQQEQLQNVLSSAASKLVNNNNNVNCHCQSCSSQQQSINNDSSTGVPLVGSSSGSFVNNNNNNYNHQYYQHHGNHQHHNDVNSTSTSLYQNGQLAASSSAASSAASSFVTHRILLRKSYWDPTYDTYILNDQQALNLLFIQTVYDIKHSLMFVDRHTYHQLESLLASDSKMEYILLARTLKYYNYVHFEPCFSDYPRPRTKVMISIGSKELNMRVFKSPKAFSSSSTTPTTSLASTSSSSSQSASNSNQQVSVQNSEHILYCTSSLVPSGYHHLITKDDLVEEEYSFKVTLIRCWRLTSLETLNSNSTTGPSTANSTVRRKSLSLFNSVVGVGNTNSNSESRQPQNDTQRHHSSIISSGTGGASLIAALNGGNNNSNNFHHHYCQHENQRCDSASLDPGQFCQYELSFEYLVSKDSLRWITISSDQAIFISISLQGVVDELVSKRDGRSSLHKGASTATTISQQQHDQQTALIPSAHRINQQMQLLINNESNNDQSFTYMYRDGAQKLMNTSKQKLIDKFGTTLGYSPMNPYALALARQRQQVRASALLLSPRNGSLTQETASGGHHQTTFEVSSFKKAPSPIINDAFEGVTNDDDL